MEIGDLTRPSPEIIEGFRNLATSTIGDVLDQMNISGVIQNIKPVHPGLKCAGCAITVKEVSGVFGTYSNADFTLGQVIDIGEEGDVIVIDNAGHQISTWGGIASFAAFQRGVKGLVVDGGVRDVDEIVEVGFPVFSRHVVPTTGKGRIKILACNIPVKIDGIRVCPGDIIVADMTGIVCVPKEVAEEVLQTATEYDAQDKLAIEDIRKGLSFSEALKKFPKI